MSVMYIGVILEKPVGQDEPTLPTIVQYDSKTENGQEVISSFEKDGLKIVYHNSSFQGLVKVISEFMPGHSRGDIESMIRPGLDDSQPTHRMSLSESNLN